MYWKKNCHEAKNHHWTTNMNLDHGATHLDLGTIKAQGSLDKRGPMTNALTTPNREPSSESIDLDEYSR